MRIHRFLSSFLALAAFAGIAMSTASHARGPEVPCTGVDCRQVPLFDTPASGFWGNPEEMGISIHLFVQNGVSFGTYYGYTETGAPIWYLFVLDFERPEDTPGLLRARTTLEQYANGSCIGCPFSQPVQADLPGTIEFTFDQRNHGTYRIDDGEAIHIVPLEINSPVVSDYADEMHYALPDPQGAWVLTFKAEAGEGYDFERVGSITGVFGEKREGSDGSSLGMAWSFSIEQDSAEAFASLYCMTESGSPPAQFPPICELRMRYPSGMFPEFDSGVRFPLPYANITGGRIVSKDPHTGIRLEAFRIGYD
jgi:hypothetical protein